MVCPEVSSTAGRPAGGLRWNPVLAQPCAETENQLCFGTQRAEVVPLSSNCLVCVVSQLFLFSQAPNPFCPIFILSSARDGGDGARIVCPFLKGGVQLE